MIQGTRMNKKFDKELIELLCQIERPKVMGDFLDGLLSAQERDEIAVRLQIVKKILAGEPQAKIAKDLGVGIATVTRGSRELKLGRFKVLR